MTPRPSSVPLRVPLLPPPESSLPAIPDPEFDLARVASPTVPHLLATVVTDPSFESTAASAIVAELVDFGATCRLDYATSLVAESKSDFPLSVGGECALGTDVLEDRQEDFECLAAAVPHLVAMLLAPEGDPDAQDIPTPRSYAETVTVYVDNLVFTTADTEALALVKSELQKRHTCIDLGELRSYLGLQNTLERARRTITLTQSHMVHQVLQRFGFQYSSPQSTPLHTGHSLSAPPLDETVEPSGSYPELVGYLMYLMTCTRPNLAYPLSIMARYVAPGRHRPEHWEAAKRVLRYLCSTLGMGLVLGGRGPVVLTGYADASWVDDLATLRSSQGYTFSLGVTLAHLPADRLGRAASFFSNLYVDNKAMIALCREHRLEQRTKHIALRYFLVRELQQRGQLCLVYVATQRVAALRIATAAAWSTRCSERPKAGHSAHRDSDGTVCAMRGATNSWPLCASRRRRPGQRDARCGPKLAAMRRAAAAAPDRLDASSGEVAALHLAKIGPDRRDARSGTPATGRIATAV
ncbi:unnamed protein product [Closterium sp. NIES-54]